MPKKKALVATGNSMLTIVHALLADPGASYHDLGPDYYEQRMHKPGAAMRRRTLPRAQLKSYFRTRAIYLHGCHTWTHGKHTSHRDTASTRPTSRLTAPGRAQSPSQ